MLCKYPFMAGAIPFGCGQCLPCRINRARLWMWRQYLEGLCHGESSFVTLTYAPGSIRGDWSLDPRALQLFFKNLRTQIAPLRVRYFAVGEYGEENLRPHYHVSLFGLSRFSVVECDGAKPRTGLEIIERSWPYGFVDVQEFNHLTAQYVAGYVTKKLADRRDGREWNHPEFARMSLRPGIGAPATAEIAKTLLGNYIDWETGDVPGVLQIGKRSIPLGRYLLARLRKEVGFSDEYTAEVKQRVSMARSVEMQAVLAHSSRDTFKAAYLDDIEGQIRQVEARAHLFKKRSKI